MKPHCIEIPVTKPVTDMPQHSPRKKTSTKKTTQSASRVKTRTKDYNALALKRHKQLKGKITTALKAPLKSKDDWSTMYTPGVGAVAAHLAKKPNDAREYTQKRNTIAVVSDGSAVLGLGNIGPYGALPVMEGKCAIFKAMADVDAVPIVLETQDPEEIIATVKRIAPGFGGINLEDITAPQCFMIEERLKKELAIPVMHDDQHGTAIVVLAGLINAAKVVKKKLPEMKVVIVGAGAAGRAIALLLTNAGVGELIVTDSKGIIYEKRPGINGHKKELATLTNHKQVQGEVLDAANLADVLIGVSGPGTITKHQIEQMGRDPIVFALANPVPEIKPADAKAAGVAVVATGRSDFPNQINNALTFPGIFRGALDKGVRDITDDMKLAAAKKLAAMIKKPTAEQIIPGVMDSGVVRQIARAIK